MMLADIAGGVTAIEGHGHWQAKTGLVKESVTLLSVSLNSTEEVLQEVNHLCKWLANRLKQEAILVKINGVAYLVASTEARTL